MTTETSPKTELLTELAPDWEPPMPPTDLIFDDGELLESKHHVRLVGLHKTAVKQV
jgi:hypothetical protein